MKEFNNYKPVVASVIEHAEKYGFQIVGVDDGQDKYNLSDEINVSKLIEHACSVDESWLYFKKDKVRFTAFLVLGNAAHETVCDFSAFSDVERKELSDQFEKAMESFSEAWENKSVPSICRPELVNEKHDVVAFMGRTGGSFVQALRHAWVCADLENRERVESAFFDVFEKYDKMLSMAKSKDLEEKNAGV